MDQSVYSSITPSQGCNLGASNGRNRPRFSTLWALAPKVDEVRDRRILKLVSRNELQIVAMVTEQITNYESRITNSESRKGSRKKIVL